MNGWLLLGVCVNALVVFLVHASGEYPEALTLTMAALVGLSALGVILVAAGMKKPGAIIAIIGCVPFVPIGLIGAIGARQVLDELKRKEFELRRGAS